MGRFPPLVFLSLVVTCLLTLGAATAECRLLVRGWSLTQAGDWAALEPLWEHQLTRTSTWLHPRAELTGRAHWMYAHSVSVRDPEASLPHYRAAQEILSETRGARDPLTLAVDLDAAFTLLEADRPSAARAALATLLEPPLALSTKQHAQALGSLAMVEMELGHLEDAVAHSDQAVALKRTIRGSDPLGLAAQLNNRGVLAREMGDKRTAEASFEKAIEIEIAHRPAGHPAIERARGNLAKARCNCGE